MFLMWTILQMEMNSYLKKKNSMGKQGVVYHPHHLYAADPMLINHIPPQS